MKSKYHMTKAEKKQVIHNRNLFLFSFKRGQMKMKQLKTTKY